ncbi:hypothetical protein [Solirubrobacter soli]|uniref:hypothetical protein n=1 Tax=Solirubrobacter soli TaxID=363832 RepID=UPI0003F623A3|nr:hypothetical protein [Solirubrobacter soli]
MQSVLVVANRTSASPTLLEAISRRAKEGPCSFTLLVPRSPHGLHRVVDPEDHGHDEAAAAIAHARPLLEEASGGEVAALVGSHDPLAAVEDALNAGRYDEVIISTLPRRLSKWLRVDIVSKVAGLGLPVTHVEARELVLGAY